MAIRFVEIHAAAEAELLNTEWVILANDGKLPFHTRGCGMSVGRRGKKSRSELGIIDPGFVLAPGDKVRMLTGRPGNTSDGDPPEDGITNYYLLLPRTYLQGAGTVLTVTLRGLAVCKGEFEPAAADGLVAPKA